MAISITADSLEDKFYQSSFTLALNLQSILLFCLRVALLEQLFQSTETAQMFSI